MRPLNVSGEVALGLAWADPFNDDLRDQFGTELYWRMLIIPSLWLTPGVQTIFQPSFNPEVDAIVVGQLKFRLTL
jgi:carbohydrate-selective porin OprB